MTEDSLLEIIRQELPISHPSLIVGSGDDCAVVRPPPEGHSLVLKTDATLEGIHFTQETDLSAVGWKALCRPISDFAAMGAIPQHALVTVAAPLVRMFHADLLRKPESRMDAALDSHFDLGSMYAYSPASICSPVLPHQTSRLPRHNQHEISGLAWSENEWRDLSRGMGKAARTFNITIIGGEITRSPTTLFISVTLSGITGPRTLLRSAAQPNDVICVTGKLGGSFQSGRHLTFLPRLLEGQWLAAQSGVHAMMDLSDGLGSDLPRLARASQCNFFIEENNIPCHEDSSTQEAITHGEDYELLVTIDPKAWLKLHADWKNNFSTLELTPIGTMTSLKTPTTPIPPGFDHVEGSKRTL